MRITCPLLTTHVLRQDLPGTPSGWDSDLLCDDTAGAGGGPLRSESARRLTPEIRQSKFPGTPRPSVTLALAAPGPLYNSAGLRSVYRARPCATRRSLTAATARLQSLRGSSARPTRVGVMEVGPACGGGERVPRSRESEGESRATAARICQALCDLAGDAE